TARAAAHDLGASRGRRQAVVGVLAVAAVRQEIPQTGETAAVGGRNGGKTPAGHIVELRVFKDCDFGVLAVHLTSPPDPTGCEHRARSVGGQNDAFCWRRLFLTEQLWGGTWRSTHYRRSRPAGG